MQVIYFILTVRGILADILVKDPTIWDLFPTKLFGKKRELTIDKLKRQACNDGSVREALRDFIKAYWCNEIETIATIRNKIVHQSGIDPKGDVKATIAKYPPGKMHIYPVSLDPENFPVDVAANGQLLIDAMTGYWASQHAQNLIHLMDQTFCTRFGLKRSLKSIKSQSFRQSDSSHRMLAPGTPLPQPLLITDIPTQQSLPVPEFKPYKPMANQKEQACAQTWHKVSKEIVTFIKETCDEVEVCDAGSSMNLAGHVQGHTLAGHDRGLHFKLKPIDSHKSKVNELGIRLRQTDFEPYITIWSTNTQMMDYRPCELSNDVKAHLIKSIQQTVSS